METAASPKGLPFNAGESIAYALGSVASKTLLKNDVGNITLFP